jgi:hypothetical protein
MLAALSQHTHHTALMNPPELRVDDLRAMLEASAPTSRLGRWFSENHAEFSDLLATLRPRWEALAVKFAEEGLISVPAAFWHKTDTPERRLARKRAAEAARQVWHRVKQRPAQADAPVPSPLARVQQRRTAPPVVGPKPSSKAADADEFRPVRRR